MAYIKKEETPEERTKRLRELRSKKRTTRTLNENLKILKMNKYFNSNVKYEESAILKLYKFYKLQIELNQAKYELLLESQKYVTNLMDREKIDSISLEIEKLKDYNSQLIKVFTKITAAIYKFTYTGEVSPNFRIILVEYFIKDIPAQEICKNYSISENSFYSMATRIRKLLDNIKIRNSYLV